MNGGVCRNESVFKTRTMERKMSVLTKSITPLSAFSIPGISPIYSLLLYIFFVITGIVLLNMAYGDEILGQAIGFVHRKIRQKDKG